MFLFLPNLTNLFDEEAAKRDGTSLGPQRGAV